MPCTIFISDSDIHWTINTATATTITIRNYTTLDL
jgi:hypothetical protein